MAPMRTLALGAALLLSAACAHLPKTTAQALPPLRLAPSALGCELALRQQLQFRFGAQARALDALLEADAGEVRLLVQALGQSGVQLHWDGRELQQQRASWLPPAVRGERVLDDLQFTLWPAAAIRAVLPAGWTLEEQTGRRVLRQAGSDWLVARRIDAQTLELENHAEGYALRVASAQPLPENCAGTAW